MAHCIRVLIKGEIRHASVTSSGHQVWLHTGCTGTHMTGNCRLQQGSTALVDKSGFLDVAAVILEELQYGIQYAKFMRFGMV